jgi:hypothetical protein
MFSINRVHDTDRVSRQCVDPGDDKHFLITRLVLRFWYVPDIFLPRPSRSLEVLMTHTVTRAQRPIRLNYALTTGA